jgi:hypothetical protein
MLFSISSHHRSSSSLPDVCSELFFTFFGKKQETPELFQS